MKTLLIFLFVPLSAFSSVLYTFSLQTPRGTEGFSYQAPDYFATPTVFLRGQDLTTCDVSGLGTNWECLSVYLRQVAAPRGPVVRVSLTFRDRTSHDPGGTLDQVEESFELATLTKEGTWRGFLNPSGASFTVRRSGEAAPEPNTRALFGTGLLGAWFWKRYRAGDPRATVKVLARRSRCSG
jgi:hypothetical protein